MRKEYRSFPFEIREIDDKKGIFKGYASVYGHIDAHETIFDRGAFSKTIKENRSRVKVLWNHNDDEPIGIPLDLQSDDHGLYIEAKISETTRGKDTLILLKDKVITELSHGFDTIQDRWEKGIRHLKEVRLWEVSPVTWGSNDMALINSVRKRFNIECRDFDSDFDEMLLKRTPWMLHDNFVCINSIIRDWIVSNCRTFRRFGSRLLDWRYIFSESVTSSRIT